MEGGKVIYSHIRFTALFLTKTDNFSYFFVSQQLTQYAKYRSI